MADDFVEWIPNIVAAKLLPCDVVAELTAATLLAADCKCAQAVVKGVLGRTTALPVISIKRDSSATTMFPLAGNGSMKQTLPLPTTAVTANAVLSALGALPPTAASAAPQQPWCVPVSSLSVIKGSEWESKALPEAQRAAAAAFGIKDSEAEGYILQLNSLVVCRAGVGMPKVGMAAALTSSPCALGGVVFSLPGEWEGGQVQIYHTDGTTTPALVASSDSHFLTTTHYTLVPAGAAVSMAPVAGGCRALLFYAFGSPAALAATSSSDAALANPSASIESAISQAEHALAHVSMAAVGANCSAVARPLGSNAFMPARRVTYLCKGVAQEDMTYASTATAADTWKHLSVGDKGAAECLIAAAARIEGACVFFCTLKVDEDWVDDEDGDGYGCSYSRNKRYGRYGYDFDDEDEDDDIDPDREGVLESQKFSLMGWGSIHQPHFPFASASASLSSASSSSSSSSSIAAILVVDIPPGYEEKVRWRAENDPGWPELADVNFLVGDGQPNELVGHVLPTQRAKDLLTPGIKPKPGSSRTVSCPAIVVCLQCTPEAWAVHLRGGEESVRLLQGVKKEIAAASLRTILTAPLGLVDDADYAGLVSVCASVDDLECARLLLALPALPPSHVIPLLTQLCASADSGDKDAALASLTAVSASASAVGRIRLATSLLTSLQPRVTPSGTLLGATSSVAGVVSPSGVATHMSDAGVVSSSDAATHMSDGVRPEVRVLVLKHVANVVGSPWQQVDPAGYYYNSPSVAVPQADVHPLLTAILRLPPGDAKSLVTALLTANATSLTSFGCINALAGAEGREAGCVVEPIVACIATVNTTYVAQLVACALAWARAPTPPAVTSASASASTVASACTTTGTCADTSGSAPGTVAPALSDTAWRAMRDRVVLAAVTRAAPHSNAHQIGDMLQAATNCRSAAALVACINHARASALLPTLNSGQYLAQGAHRHVYQDPAQVVAGDWVAAARTEFKVQEWLAPLVAKVVASSAPGTGSIAPTSWGRLYTLVREATEAACSLTPSASHASSSAASDAECETLLKLCANLVEHLAAAPASTPPLQPGKENKFAIEACAAAIEFAMWVWVYPMTRKGVTDHSMSDTTVIASVGPGAASAPTSPTTRERLATLLRNVCRPDSSLLSIVENSPSGMQAVVKAVDRLAATCTPHKGPKALAAVQFATPLVDTFVVWLRQLVAVPAPIPSYVYPTHNGFTPCGAPSCQHCPAIAAFLVSAAPTLSLAITNATQYKHVSRLVSYGVDVNLERRVPHSKSTQLAKRNSSIAAAVALQQRERLTTTELLAGLTQVPSTPKAPLSPGASLKATLARLLADPPTAAPSHYATVSSRPLVTAATTGSSGSTAAAFVSAGAPWRSPYASVAATASSLTTPALAPGAATGASMSATAHVYSKIPAGQAFETRNALGLEAAWAARVQGGVSGVKRPFTAIDASRGHLLSSSGSGSGRGRGVWISTAGSSALQAAVGPSAKISRIEANPTTTHISP